MKVAPTSRDYGKNTSANVAPVWYDRTAVGAEPKHRGTAMGQTGLRSLVTRSFGAINRTYRTVLFSHSERAHIDPYEPSPMGREDLMALFQTEPTSPWSTDSDMRASERLEHHSMTMIRDALYPPSDAVSVSKT